MRDAYDDLEQYEFRRACGFPEGAIVTRDTFKAKGDDAFIASIQKFPKSLDTQIGGDHYKTLAIQPVEYIHRNNIGYFEGNVIKYVTRWRTKGGVADLEKAKHYLELLIELENPQ
jgi:hypothetical protein